MSSMNPALPTLLAAWLPGKRWFAASPGDEEQLHLKPVGGFSLEDPYDRAKLEVRLVEVTHGVNGQPLVLQLPLSYYGHEQEHLQNHLVGVAQDAQGERRYIYDGVADPVFVRTWLDIMASEFSDDAGQVITSGASPEFKAAASWNREDTGTFQGSVQMIAGEQSNSSVIVRGETLNVIVKFFRVLGEGENPDLEVGRALSENGSREVPKLHGWVSGSWSEASARVIGSLCVCTEFIPGAADAWTLAVQSVVDASDFRRHAYELGRTLTRVHAQLVHSFGVKVASKQESNQFRVDLSGRILWALGELGTRFEPYRSQIDQLLQELEGVNVGSLQRIHGDLHLGQILHNSSVNSMAEWLVLDFEGEPLRTVEERVRPDSTLRDVVGMMRSFDYACAMAVRNGVGEEESHAWREEIMSEFLRGYGCESGEEESVLYRALWLDKALYEVVYEERNRPSWVDVPETSVRHFLEKEATMAKQEESLGTSGARRRKESVEATVASDLEVHASPSVQPDQPENSVHVDASVLEKVADGRYHAPHDVLGAHLRGGKASSATVRTVAHLATAVTLIAEGGERFPMKHEYGGIFVVEVPLTDAGHAPDYRIEVVYEGQEPIVVDDPYRYLPSVGELDLHLIGEGRHEQLWTVLGANIHRYGSVVGVSFAVWAPNAEAVRVKGEFNGWDGRRGSMRSLGSTGIWELFVPDITPGARYKFEILTHAGQWIEKADPMAKGTEVPPLTASRVVDLGYEFHDNQWMAQRAESDPHNSPMSVYEVHLGSWRPGLDYRQLASELVEYVKWMGFTHVEFMPVAEHPFGGSWGYQVTSYYAPTSRFGHPNDFKFLVDALHQAGIGVLMDWVPAHFPKDSWALARFDGEALYEHADPRLGEHPDWGTLIFNYGRKEVRNFLTANALFWLEEFHIDGLRVDAVASMLYLDYSRKAGEWLPNKYGGRENLEAIDFLQEVNATAYRRSGGVVMIAEESTAFPKVTAATDQGGIGFGLKWNMGWMHDSLSYIAEEPINRKWHHNEATFSLVYAFTENFLLPISHDEVVHGKGSLLRKMPGDRWQQLANVRAFLAWQWAHPGKKLIFMGTEFAQEAEWNEQHGLDWWLTDDPSHRGVQLAAKEVNELYKKYPALWEQDNTPAGFSWINGGDADNNVLSFVRWSSKGDPLVCVVNFSGNPHHGYRIGLPEAGAWSEVLNTDAQQFGGSGVGNGGSVIAEGEPADGQPNSTRLTLPPLAALWLVPARLA